MKKIFLAMAMLAGVFTSAMAQTDSTATTKDSVYVVKDGSVVAAYEVGSDIDYIAFKRPEVDSWKTVISEAPTYYYYGGSYNYPYTYKTTIQQEGTSNYFYVDNFLNSGGGFTFKIKNADGTYSEVIEDINTVDGILEPVNGEGVSVSDYGAWSGCSFYANGEWGWTDEVNNATYESFYFYGGSGYATFKGTQKYIELVCYPSIDGKEQFSTLYIDWC